jgi:hypothetical protein
VTTAEDKKTIEEMWRANFLNIRRATMTNVDNKTQRIVVGLELYDVCIDYQNNLYPWAREALQYISDCNCFRLYVWTNQADKISSAVVDNIFVPNGIKVKGVNSGFFVTNPDYSKTKPWIDVLIDKSSGFDTNHWYWVYNMFRLSDMLMCHKDDSVTRKIVHGNEKFAVRPTTVKMLKPL